MIRPAHIEKIQFLYAAGNTPAVNLTQSLPPEDDADLLLLGCGDVRNVLYTTYAGAGFGNRKLDFTCCDISTEIIARNILFLTLILDDHDGRLAEQTWNTYYDVLLDTKSLDLLRKQALKLKCEAQSIDTWHSGKHGKILRFANIATFNKVIRLWDIYSLPPGDRFMEYQKQLQTVLTKARDMKKHHLGEGSSISGVRSAAPCATIAASEIGQTYDQYWKIGTTRLSKEKNQTPNPMFASLSGNAILHYGTDPLLGYHLALAYAPLADKSPLKPPFGGVPNGLNRAADAALAEFSAWAASFRTMASMLTIRFVNADAIALCHSLQHKRASGGSANWYRDNWHHEELVLDAEDYEGSAPTTFDVIDTSNLIDHLGAINVLTSAAPLLNRQRPSSTIQTEMLVRREQNIEAAANALLCGDLATASLLFGLIPVQYWTNVTATSTLDESMLDRMAEAGATNGGRARYVVIWKVNTLHVKFESKQLAGFVYRMYLQMFQDESFANLFTTTPEQRRLKQYEHYTRAGLVAVLREIKNMEFVEWDEFMEALEDKISSNQTLNMGNHYLQELYLHLHLGGVYTMPPLANDFGEGMKVNESRLSSWESLPPMICLTLVVPTHKLDVFRKWKAYASPICHIMLQHAGGQQNILPDLQLGFATVSTSGTRYKSNFKVRVVPDEKGWDGNSPLVVSVLAPTWTLLLDKNLSTQIVLALKSTPTSMLLAQDLGMFLEIHTSTLASEDVLITKHRPNMSGHMSICPSPKPITAQMSSAEVGFTISLNSDNSRLESVTVHLDILLDNDRALLSGGAAVKVTQPSALSITIEIGSGAFTRTIILPVPACLTGKTRIARKSSYIEYIVPVAAPMDLARDPDRLLPVHLTGIGHPTLTNLHYVMPDKLPILNPAQKSKLQWFNPHISSMWSARERKLREQHQLQRTTCNDIRTNFKDSLFSMCMHFTGVDGTPKSAIFGINNPTGGGIHILIFAYCIRMDLSNQGVFLDGAALPLDSESTANMGPFLTKLQSRGIMSIKVDEEELVLWKHVLPVFAERCRDWKHSARCEYKAKGKIPLSTKMGEPFMCTCGFGKFPESYKPDVPQWNHIREHCVRVAICPVFSVPFVEKGFSLPVQKPDMLNHMDQLTEGLMNWKFKQNALEKKDKGMCWSCKLKPAAASGALLKCGGCKVAEYCSKECQTKDWKAHHKKLCKTLG